MPKVSWLDRIRQQLGQLPPVEGGVRLLFRRIVTDAPQPRAVLRIVNPDKPDEIMPYGEYGRVELTTMTREFFVPRFLERDEAIRRAPRAPYAWDGVAEVRPFGAMEKTIVEGVY